MWRQNKTKRIEEIKFQSILIKEIFGQLFFFVFLTLLLDKGNGCCKTSHISCPW